MKQLIVPVTIIIALIAFFVIIDRKEFSRHDDVQTVQSESPTANRKPTVSIPETKPITEVKSTVETKPVETKPDVETRPVAENLPVTVAKPVTESMPKTDVKSAETKPVAETYPDETKPAEAKPVAGTKPVETKPMSQAKPMPETKPAEVKPAETKPLIKMKSNKPAEIEQVAETRPEEKPIPVAVPFVTAEEAEKLNEFAIFLQTIKKTVIEGEISERSDLPDPESSDYPNCRFTAHFVGNAIKSGEPCPKEIALIFEGFENFRILETDALKSGDKVQCKVVPFECLSEEFQSTQQADDLNLFLLENYYVVDFQIISSFTDDPFIPQSGIFFSDGNTEYVSVFERHINPPISEDVIKAQNTAIQNDLKKMNSLLNGYDDEKIKTINELFADVWKKEKEKDIDDYNRVGSYVWRNIDNSFWCLPINYTILSKPNLLTSESIECFAALKRVCEANGVHLIVSLVPGLHVISARVINKDFRDIADVQTATFVKQLSEIGVETIYSSDAIIRNYNRYPFAFFYPSDGHPSDTAQDVITDIISERLKRYNCEPTLEPVLFSEKLSPPKVYGNDDEKIFPDKCDIGNNETGNTRISREIVYNGKQITRSKTAPIMIIGNSYQQTPMNTDSIPTLLSYKLNIEVDWYRIGGYGPFSDIIIQFLSRADFFLENKKVLLFYVGTDHLNNVNKAGTMLNIAKLDRERVLLNNKQIKGRLLLQTNAADEEVVDSKLWGPISNAEKTVLKINESGELTYSFEFEQIDNSITDSDPIVCIVPHTCVCNTTCKININGKEESMHSSNLAQNARFFNLTYELPAGTKEIIIKIEGKPGTLIAIKDIQIWQ